MTLNFPDLSGLRFLLSLDYPKFNFHLNHLPHQPTGVGIWGRRSMGLLWARRELGPLHSCQLPPLCGDSLVCRRIEMYRAWLPSQTPLFCNSLDQTQQLCMTLEEWLIIYLGLPSSHTVENLICLSIAWFHYVVKKMWKFFSLSFLSV